MKPALKAILFDLDGTLVDSVPDLAWAIDQMQAHFQLPPCGENQVRNWVGNGVDQLVRRALTNGNDTASVDPMLYSKALASFKHHYGCEPSRYSRTYPHVEDTLDHFARRHIKLAVVTNKATRFTEQLLADKQLDSWLSATVCGDTLAVKKPAPQPLSHALKLMNVAPDAAVMVGDSKNDVGAARALKLPVICKTGGYNHGEDIALSQPDAIFDDFSELPDCIDQVWHAGQ